MTKPITPNECVAIKEKSLPDAVIVAFNRAIAEKWDGRISIIRQEFVALQIADALGIPVSDVISRGYLDVEPIYRKAGWKVKYDKPGYNESYPATFEFSK